MIKKMFFLSLMLCFGLWASVQANPYVVLDVRGEIALASNGSLLKQGDMISNEDAVTFGTDGMAALCSSEAGRFMLKGEAGASGNVASLVAAGVKKVKAEAPQAFASDASFAAYFSPSESEPFYNGHFVVLGDMEWYSVDPKKYPLDMNNFFFAQYDYEDLTVSKGLPFEKKEFALERSELYSSSGQQVVFDQDKIRNGTILYYNSVEYRHVCDFKPYFISKDELSAVVKLMEPWLMKATTYDVVVQEVQALIADMYGKAGKGDVDQFIRRNYPTLMK